jgi:DNA polymerase
MSLLDEIAAQVNSCQRCPLGQTRTMAVPGAGPPDARIMFVGEGPGRDEDLQGEPFVGRAGKVLTKLLRRIGLSREDVFITNIVKCRPPDNRDPQPDEVSACREYLDGQIAFIRPVLICTMGRPALQTLVDPSASVMKLNGTVIEREGLVFVPLIHPAAGLHQPQMKDPTIEGFDALGRILQERG